MRRADALLLGIVGALGIFVATQTLRAPRRQPLPVIAREPSEHASADSVAAPAVAVHDVEAGPRTEPERVRWPDRRMEGLRIWVQTATEMRDWNNRYAQMARDAFDDWGEADLPIRFDFILDSATADIRVLWIERFSPEAGQRVGRTLRGSNSRGWLTTAQISVAVHDSTGQAIPPSALLGIMRHEAGHALGLGHSSDPRTKMYPIERTPEITAADRAALKALYESPPGPVR